MKHESIEGMFKELSHEIAIETISGRTVELINSLHIQFIGRGTLSIRQKDLLKKLYKQYVGGY